MRLPAELKPIRRTAAGLTLVEVLISLGIVAVLAGIALTVAARAKDRGKAADDVSRLRQLGQAAALYEEQHGSLPFACAQVVQAGYAPGGLCEGTADPVSRGTAAACDRFSPVDDVFPDPGFRVTYVGLANVRIWPGAATWKLWSEKYYRKLEAAPGFGWLVDNQRQQDGPGFAGWSNPEDCFFGGPYRRLLADGAVVVRTKRWHKVKGQDLYDRATWFADIELEDLME